MCDSSCTIRISLQPSSPQQYSCNKDDGTCVPDPKGTQSKADCTSSCKQQMYTCDADTGTCNADQKGTQTKTACTSSCKQQMYTCDADAGTCNADQKGTQTKTACAISCKQQMYTCDADAGTCKADNSGKQSKEDCTSSCKQQMYTCNAGKCIADSKGTLTKNKCLSQGDCQATKYVCNKDSGTCSVNPSGTQTNAECTSLCKQQMYTCDADTGTCNADQKGTLTKDKCTSSCKQTMYTCDTDAGTCNVDQKGTLTKDKCTSSCKQTMYTCDTDAGTCNVDQKGTLTKDKCTSSCKQTMYKCDTDAGTCNVDPKGTLTKDKCTSSCKQTMYKCDTDAGTCNVDPKGTQTKDKCTSSCKQTMYTCDTDAGTCNVDPKGTLTKDKCTSSCKQTMYKCDTDAGTCNVDPKGTLTKDKCTSSCKQTMYKCDTDAGTCNVDPKGTQTKDKCTSSCKQTMYTCDTDTGTCNADPKGTQTKEACASSCKASPAPSPGPSSACVLGPSSVCPIVSSPGSSPTAPVVGGHPQCWMEQMGLDGVAAVPPLMYGDWGMHGQGCSFNRQNAGLCYRLTSTGKPAVSKTIAIVGRCGGYAQCELNNPDERAKGAKAYQGVSTNLPLFQPSLDANVDGNFCLTQNSPAQSSSTVAGSTSVCYKGMTKNCLPMDKLSTCGKSGSDLCNVDWCASNLHPHFDLNSELVKEMLDPKGRGGSGFIATVMPVPCPHPKGSPFPIHRDKDHPTPTPIPACATAKPGEEMCTCRGMKPVSLGDQGEYGMVCVPLQLQEGTPSCNQDPYTLGLSSKVHSDRCPIAIGYCDKTSGQCVPHTSSPDGSNDSWVKKMFGIEAKPDLINTFPQPSVTEYCDLKNGGCGGWNVACNIQALTCDPNNTKLQPLGGKCDNSEKCESYNCCWYDCKINGTPTPDTGICADGQKPCSPANCVFNTAYDNTPSAAYKDICKATCDCNRCKVVDYCLWDGPTPCPTLPPRATCQPCNRNSDCVSNFCASMSYPVTNQDLYKKYCGGQDDSPTFGSYCLPKQEGCGGLTENCKTCTWNGDCKSCKCCTYNCTQCPDVKAGSNDSRCVPAAPASPKQTCDDCRSNPSKGLCLTAAGKCWPGAKSKSDCTKDGYTWCGPSSSQQSTQQDHENMCFNSGAS